MQIISRSEAKKTGLKKYFTGKPCSFGHIAERHTSCGVCTLCHRKNNLRNKTTVGRIKNNARNRIYKARKRNGMQAMPCERCGEKENIHAHHEDYSKPLEVMWLCNSHHAERHRELKLAGATQ